MASAAWRWARSLGGVAILALLVWRLGTGPFLGGLQVLSPLPLAAAAGITLLTTACSAWRWCVIARGLGADLPWPAAVAAYYRSQFLNCALPGGILGDVHRGLHHGRETGDAGRGLRAVAWERTSGQVVQAVLTLAVLAAFASPVRTAVLPVSVGVLAVVLVSAVLLRGRAPAGPGRLARFLRAVRADLRDGLLTRRAWLPVTVASLVVVVGYVSTFLIAARTAGVTASPAALLPLAVLALLAMAVPLNVAGWGPREGVAAWAFAASGLGADQGIATATVYGVLGLVATLPGAFVLLADALGRRQPVAVAVAAQLDGARG